MFFVNLLCSVLSGTPSLMLSIVHEVYSLSCLSLFAVLLYTIAALDYLIQFSIPAFRPSSLSGKNDMLFQRLLLLFVAWSRNIILLVQLIKLVACLSTVAPHSWAMDRETLMWKK